MRTISGKQPILLSHEQKLKLARATVENIIMRRKDRQCLKYILSFAKARLKIRGDDLSLTQIKKILDRIMPELKIQEIQAINMHILSLSLEGVKEVIERLQFLEKEEINATLQ